MKLRIETKKVVKDGQRWRKIVDIEGLSVDKLPVEYLKGTPNCFVETVGKFKNFLHVNTNNNKSFSMIKNDIFHEEHFKKMMVSVAKAGDRLHEILQKQKETNAKMKLEWNGKEDFEI